MSEAVQDEFPWAVPTATCGEFLISSGRTIAVAESLTGGLLAAELVSVPGISAVFRGGAVTYAIDTKASVLGVNEERLARTGPVHAVVAQEMAIGVTMLYGSQLGLATTGVAGPGPADGHPAGTVWIGFAGDVSRCGNLQLPTGLSDMLETSVGNRHAWAWKFHFTGGRTEVRRSTVHAALTLLYLANKPDNEIA